MSATVCVSISRTGARVLVAFWSKGSGPQAHLILVLEARVSVELLRRNEEVEFCGKEGTSMSARVRVSISRTGARFSVAFWGKDSGPQAHLILVLEARVFVESWRRNEEVEFCGKEGSSMSARVCVSISRTGARALGGLLE